MDSVQKHNICSWRTSSCFRDVGGGNLSLNLVSQTDQNGSIVSKSGDVWPGKTLKFTFIHFKPWRNGSSCCRLVKLHCCSNIRSGSWDIFDCHPVHVLPCSNSAMKGNNGINITFSYDTVPKSSQNIPRILLLETGVPDCRLPWKFKCKLFLMEGTAWRTTHLTISRVSNYLMSRFYGRDGAPSFTHLSITFSYQRFSNCSPTVYVEFVKLTWNRFFENSVLKMNIQFCCPVTCAVVLLWFLEKLLPNVRRSLSASVDFRPLFLFADVVFPWLVYAVNITSETVALDTPNNVAVFQLNAHQRSVLFENRTSPSISNYFKWSVTEHNH
jgi:hypothetical protein